MSARRAERAAPAAPPVLELPPGLEPLRLHEEFPERYPYLLESVAGGTPQGRFDILFAATDPAVLRREAGGAVRGPAGPAADFAGALDAWFRDESIAPFAPAAPAATADDSLPFTGGWFLFLAYELAAELEPRLSLPEDPGYPVGYAARVRAALIRDRHRRRLCAVAEPGAEGWLETIAHDAAHAAKRVRQPFAGPLLTGGLEEEAPARFLAAVRRAREHIAAGDIYQANLSRGWRGELAAGAPAGELYRRLCASNPAPFGGLARLGDALVVSSSPERLLSIRGRRVATRPIAGTRPRAAAAAADAALVRELIAHPKERAEHVMLIDLERNDLGRICRAGSVRVDEMMAIESYSHVHHIVSNVSGELRDGVTPGEALRAVFPGGTITGCPKLRCMEIIAELERTPRGPYTGSMGYLNRDGSLDLNILIRSLGLRGRRVGFRAGSGIVADSVPVRELAETRAKAKGMSLALGAEAAPCAGG